MKQAPSHFPLRELLVESTKNRATSDITIWSTGLVSLRTNKAITSREMLGIADSWATMMAVEFPKVKRDAVGGHTTTLQLSPQMRFRVNWSRNYLGESLAIRPLPQVVPDAETLRLPLFLRDYLLGLKGGIVIIGGPTGSGKSTTIACMLKWIAEARGGKIITIEDPIEFVHKNNARTIFEQRELGTHVMSYADGLKEALHMNPDIIEVQEIREPAAAEVALSAALSGHLVLASMHAYTAATTPQRYLSILNPSMEDIGARDALASCLEAVVLQRLVPGRDGLVPIFEIMTFRDQQMNRLASMERLVRDGKWVALRQEIEVGKQQGMCLWDDSERQRREEGLI